MCLVRGYCRGRHCIWCYIFLLLLFKIHLVFAPVKSSVWLNSKEPCVAFQDWLCSSSVLLLWQEELVPALPWVPSERPSALGSPGSGSWRFCLAGLKVGTANLWAWAAGAVHSAVHQAPVLLQALCPGEFCLWT